MEDYLVAEQGEHEHSGGRWRSYGGEGMRTVGDEEGGTNGWRWREVVRGGGWRWWR